MSSETKKFKKAAKKYLESQKYRLRPSSYASYSHLLYKRIIPKIGEIKVRDFGKKNLQEFVNASLKNGYSKHGVRDCVSLIKLVLRFSAENGWCEEQIMQVTYPKRAEIMKDHFFAEDDYKRLYDYCMENSGYRTLPTLLAMVTGLRIGEVCGLRWADIDTAKGILSVERSVKRICVPGEKSVLEISEPKTASSTRIVPIPESVIPILVKERKEPEIYLSSGTEKPLEPRSYRQKYIRILDNLGIERHTFHDLRHTFASRCINHGGDARAVADILGHVNVEMTLNVYTHSTSDHRREIIERACAI